MVAAACDGACRGNPGPGGWGCLLRFEDGSVRELKARFHPSEAGLAEGQEVGVTFAPGAVQRVED